VTKLEERPALITELLFSKINSTAHYLEYGHEKQTISSNPKPAAELEFRRIVEHDRQVAIAVAALLDKNQEDHINWVKSQLGAAESERRAWEGAEKAMASVEGLDAEASGENSVEAPVESAVKQSMPISKSDFLSLLSDTSFA
jgi:replication fork protection complex subunit Tof1/Swi1